MFNRRLKIVTAFASLAMMASSMMVSSTNAEEAAIPARLKSHVEVIDDKILLGDVFEGIDRYAESAIAKSPKPGQETTLPATWLWRIAKLYRVNWQPTSKLDISIVSRTSTRIDAQTVTEHLKMALFEKTGEDDLVELAIKSNIVDLHISPKSEASLRVNRLTHDNNTGRFNAEIVAPASGSAETRVVITGILHPLVEAAVPNRCIMPGEIIRNGDLEWMKFRKRNVNNKAILDPSQIIGKAAKRTLIAGKTISLNSVQPPVLVKKNGLVTVTLNTAFMQITTQGKALQNGAMDELVQIRNLQSDIVIEALVTGAGKAVVITPAELAMR